jgi:hypothetical protein
MKIIERDDAKLNEENEMKAYFLSLQSNRKFQKYVIQGLVAPKLKRLTNYKHLYEDEAFIDAKPEKIASVHNQNRNTYLVLKTMLSPVLTEEDRETL